MEMESDQGGGGVNTDWTRLVHGTIQDSEQWNIPPAYRDNVNRSARMALTHGVKKKKKKHVIHFTATGGQ